jgi:uncharacterized protein (TIGR00266 family)
VQSHDIEFRVHGEDLQFVEIYLDQGETVIGEAGAMMYMDEGVSFEAKMGDGSGPPEEGFFKKAKAAAKRAVTGEGLFLTHFTNVAGHKRRVAFASPIPGRVVPIDLAQSGGRILAQKSAFLCAALGSTLGVAAAGTKGEDGGGKKWLTRMAGGEGWLLQTIEGDGLAFLNAGGMVIEHQLEGNKLLVDTGCIVGFDSSIEYSVEQVGGLKSSFLGGEGLFLATLQGTGRVWLQSLTVPRLGDELTKNSPWLRGELRDLDRKAGSGS